MIGHGVSPRVPDVRPCHVAHLETRWLYQPRRGGGPSVCLRKRVEANRDRRASSCGVSRSRSSHLELPSGPEGERFRQGGEVGLFPPRGETSGGFGQMGSRILRDDLPSPRSRESRVLRHSSVRPASRPHPDIGPLKVPNPGRKPGVSADVGGMAVEVPNPGRQPAVPRRYRAGAVPIGFSA